MKGLLYKDLHLVKKTVLTGIIFIVVASLFVEIITLGFTVGNFKLDDENEIKNTIIRSFVLLVAGCGIGNTLMCSNVMAMDEMSGWYRVFDSSPVPAWKEILSRYILMIILNTLFTAMFGIIQPIILISGECGYGMEQIKLTAYMWLAGFILICLMLPIEILFPAKRATAIRITLNILILAGLIVWLSIVEYLDIIIAAIADFMKLMYRFRFVLIPALGVFSYMVVYLCRRMCGWRRL